jgi:transposase
MMPGVAERRSFDYARAGTTDLFAALDVATGLVIHSIQRRHRAIEFKKFLKQIDHTVPAELDVHLICDNLSTHKTPAITAWLAAHPRFQLHFTPTSSSWLNQVERWFGLLTERQLRRGVHDNVSALEHDIGLDRAMEQQPPTLHLDQNRRRNPSKTRPISTTNSWRRTLGPGVPGR